MILECIEIILIRIQTFRINYTQNTQGNMNIRDSSKLLFDS